MSRGVIEWFDRYFVGSIDRRTLLSRVAILAGSSTAACMLLSLVERRCAEARTAGHATPRSSREVVMMSLQEMSDQLEIQKNVWDYSNAVDLKDFDALDDVFTPDARISYGEKEMSLPEAKAWLKQALTTPHIRGYYHLMGNMWIKVTGDTAESRTRCFNPMEFIQPDGQVRLWFNGIWYHWKHVRTPKGWRISSRWPEPAGGHLKSFDWTTPSFPPDQKGAPVIRPDQHAIPARP